MVLQRMGTHIAESSLYALSSALRSQSGVGRAFHADVGQVKRHGPPLAGAMLAGAEECHGEDGKLSRRVRLVKQLPRSRLEALYGGHGREVDGAPRA